MRPAIKPLISEGGTFAGVGWPAMMVGGLPECPPAKPPRSVAPMLPFPTLPEQHHPYVARPNSHRAVQWMPPSQRGNENLRKWRGVSKKIHKDLRGKNSPVPMSPQEISDTGCKSSLTYSWWLSHIAFVKKGWTMNNVNTLWSCYLLLMEETVSWYEDLQIQGWCRMSTIHSRLVVIVVLAAVVIATVVIMYFHVFPWSFKQLARG